MRWIFLSLLILSVIGIYLSAQQQDQRDAQQTALLVRLERVGTDEARTLVDEWRRERAHRCGALGRQSTALRKNQHAIRGLLMRVLELAVGVLFAALCCAAATFYLGNTTSAPHSRSNDQTREASSEARPRTPSNKD
jgi:hypothetical protein